MADVFLVRVVVRENSNADARPIHDKTGDHAERYFRDWITNTMWWAARNDKSVSVYPVPR